MHWDTSLILVLFQPMWQNHAENLIKLRTRKTADHFIHLETDIHAFVLFRLGEGNAQLNKNIDYLEQNNWFDMLQQQL